MKNIIQSLKVVALGLMLAIGLSYAFAWTPPTGNPPAGNVSAPVNVSNSTQIKSGTLQVNGFRNIGTTVLDGNVGIGTTAPEAKLQITGGGLHIKGIQGAPSQGIAIGWNHDGGSGATWLVNNAGLGVGGFRFDNVKDGVQTRLMTISESGTVCDGTGACIGGGGGGTLSCNTLTSITPVGGSVTVNCPAGYIMTGGSASRIDSWRDNPFGNGWTCSAIGGESALCYVRCCRIQ